MLESRRLLDVGDPGEAARPFPVRSASIAFSYPNLGDKPLNRRANRQLFVDTRPATVYKVPQERKAPPRADRPSQTKEHRCRAWASVRERLGFGFCLEASFDDLGRHFRHHTWWRTMTISPGIRYPMRLLRRPHVAEYCGVGTSTLDKWIDLGRIPQGIRVDGVVVWDIRQVDAAIDRLIGVDAGANLADSGGGAHSVWDD